MRANPINEFIGDVHSTSHHLVKVSLTLSNQHKLIKLGKQLWGYDLHFSQTKIKSCQKTPKPVFDASKQVN